MAMTPATSTMPALLRLMRFDRPIGTLLLLWPTLWGLWAAARGIPDPANLAICGAGVVVMRAAGCVINDYADRNFDPHVARTRQRPIAAGEITPRQALLVFAALLAIAFGLVLLTNALTVKLALVGALLASSYPFFKRFTHWPQVVLGAAFGWAIPMAFAAETGAVAPLAWWLFGANVLWSVIYDTEYAMVDRADDLRVGVKSTAIRFGRWDRTAIALLQLGMLGVLGYIGWRWLAHWPHWYALAITTLLFGYHQWLIRKREPAGCFRAFLHNNWVGMVVFLGIAVSYAAAVA